MQGVVFCVEGQVRLEGLFGGGVEDPALEGTSIGIPVDKDELADVHVVFILELEIENTEAEVVLRENGQE